MANDPFQFAFEHVTYDEANESNLSMIQAVESTDEQLVLHPVARAALRRGWYLADSSRTADGRPIRKGNQNKNAIFDRAVVRLMRLLSEAPKPRERWIDMIEQSMQRIVTNISMRPPWTERSPLLKRLPCTDRSPRIKNHSRNKRIPRVQKPMRPLSPTPEQPPTETTLPPTPDNKQ